MPLIWKQGRYGSTYGYAGKLQLFSVSYSSMRHEDGRMYVVKTALPWAVGEDDRCATKEEGRERCEILLSNFLRYVTKHTGQEGKAD